MKNKFENSTISVAKKTALALAVLSFVIMASACSKPAAVAPSLTIENPWTRVVPDGEKMGAAYMNIVNVGGEDKLLSASSPVSSIVELHEMAMEGDKMKMRKVDSFVVPENGTLVLKPHDYHVMFLDLKKGLKEGEKVEIELTFEKSGVKKVTAEVKPLPANMKPEE